MLPSSASSEPEDLVVGNDGPAFASGSGLIRQIATQILTSPWCDQHACMVICRDAFLGNFDVAVEHEQSMRS